MTVPILVPEQHWECPNCDLTDVTHHTEPTSRMHRCRGLNGLDVPMAPAGTRCKIETVEREDWIGTEQVQTDGEGRPIMAAVTTRDDGEDRAVYVPTINLNLRSVL